MIPRSLLLTLLALLNATALCAELSGLHFVEHVAWWIAGALVGLICTAFFFPERGK